MGRKARRAAGTQSFTDLLRHPGRLVDQLTGDARHRAWDIPYIQPAADGTCWVSGPLRSETVGPQQRRRPSPWWSSTCRQAAVPPSWVLPKNSQLM
jgi:hypothetical protein